MRPDVVTLQQPAISARTIGECSRVWDAARLLRLPRRAVGPSAHIKPASRRCRLPPRLRHGPRRHRVQAARIAVSFRPAEGELCRRLGDEVDQGGVVSRHFDDLDAVLEFDALDDFGQLIFALQSSPCFRSGVDECKRRTNCTNDHRYILAARQDLPGIARHGPQRVDRPPWRYQRALPRRIGLLRARHF